MASKGSLRMESCALAIKGELPAPVALHRGETEAILLARELSADALLMDELDGRAVARQRGLTVIGTVGTRGKEKRALEFGAAKVVNRAD